MIDLQLFKHRADVQLRFSDIDLQGHASNTVYQNYFDIGKSDYLQKVLEIDWRAMSFVAASAKLDYFLPIYLHSHIQALTRVTALGNKSITIEQCLVDLDSGAVTTVCETVLVCFCPKSRKSVPLSDEWRRKFEVFEGRDLSKRD